MYEMRVTHRCLQHIRMPLPVLLMQLCLAQRLQVLLAFPPQLRELVLNLRHFELGLLFCSGYLLRGGMSCVAARTTKKVLTARVAAFVNAFAASARIVEGVRVDEDPLGAMVA